MSELVKTMIPEEEDGETDQQEIPLPNVKSQILGKVMEFCKHYCEEPMNEIEKPLKRFVTGYFWAGWCGRLCQLGLSARDGPFALPLRSHARARRLV